MINPNYNYTNPISAINTINIAKGVPYPTEDRKPVREIEDNYNKNGSIKRKATITKSSL